MKTPRVEIEGFTGPCLGADYTPDEVEFLRAMDGYKSQMGRPFPTWREVLAVLQSLGYRKVAEATAMPRPVMRTGGKRTGFHESSP